MMPATRKYDIDNCDKIILLSHSGVDFGGYIKGKSWYQMLSEFSDYNWLPYAVGGSTTTRVLQDMSNGQDRNGGFNPRRHSGSFGLIFCVGNDTNRLGDNKSGNLNYYRLTLRKLIRQTKAANLVPVVTDDQICPPEIISVIRGVAAEENVRYIPMKSKLDYLVHKIPFKGVYYWGAHPGTRVSMSMFNVLREELENILPPPMSGIKLFRAVNPHVKINSLLYDSMIDRHRRWREINIGLAVLKKKFEKRYDTSLPFYGPDNAGKNIANEYERIGEGIKFKNYMLGEFISDCGNPDKICINLSGELDSLDAYLLNSTVHSLASGADNRIIPLNAKDKTKSLEWGIYPGLKRFVNNSLFSWDKVNIADGKIIVKDMVKYLNNRKVTLLLRKNGEFTIDNVSYEITGGIPQPLPVLPEKAVCSDKLAEINFPKLPPKRWKISGEITEYEMDPNDRAPYGTEKILHLAKGASLELTGEIPVEPSPFERELLLSIPARYAPLNEKGNIADAPQINTKSFDFACLACGLSCNNAEEKSFWKEFIFLESFASIMWGEMKYRFTVPPHVNAIKIRIEAGDSDIQITGVNAYLER